MAAIGSGQTVKVQIETPGGEVYDLTGLVVSFDLSVDRDYSELIPFGMDHPKYFTPTREEFSIEIRGIGPFTRKSIFEKAAEVERLHYAAEWQCPYCGHINPREARNCGAADDRTVGCGAVRPFIYEE